LSRIEEKEELERCVYGFSGVAEVAKDMREKPEVLSAVQKMVALAEESLVVERDYLRSICNFVSVGYTRKLEDYLLCESKIESDDFGCLFEGYDEVAFYRDDHLWLKNDWTGRPSCLYDSYVAVLRVEDLSITDEC
jgi:hypothetical protein